MISDPQEVTRMAAPTLVVDADGHVLEHPDGMLRFAPAEYRERIWHIETKADGSEWLHYNGGVRPAGGMALAGTAGMTGADRTRRAPHPPREGARPGGRLHAPEPSRPGPQAERPRLRSDLGCVPGPRDADRAPSLPGP